MKKIFIVLIACSVFVFTFVLLHQSGYAFSGKDGMSFNSEAENNIEQNGPPWFNNDWKYRSPVVINSEVSLPWYQVLITLNSNNFDFNKAQNDGSDIRFTHSDGTTELNYWIESWNSLNELAYIWVRVPALSQGETRIYLYFNNPTVDTASDGLTTFDGFDDEWSQFSGGKVTQFDKIETADEVESPFIWSVILGIPTVSSGALQLDDGTGIKSNSTYLNQALGFRANYGLGNGKELAGFINGSSGQRTLIGDLPADVNDLYLINYLTGMSTTILEGVDDWHNTYHTYELRWQSGWSEGDIDHGTTHISSTNQVPNSYLPVTFYSLQGSNATLKVDWAYVRQFHNPEPAINVGGEQGLVELNLTMHDSPDPLPIGVQLTYQLSIENTSMINAPGVVVTDTLPVDVELGSVSSSQGNCIPGVVIVCDLDTVFANTTARITVITTPTVDGVITNTASVMSPGYEWDFSDNGSEVATLVDSEPPVVNWEKPVEKGTYFALGNKVLLEASATDNDQVASVEFIYWDHIEGKWVSIGTDDTYPYQVYFDIGDLVFNQTYQTFVSGTDRAGNTSDPYNPLQVIYIVRRFSVFLPVEHK
jgi:uncharacterized repeat protein (TIGR01451 family)